MATTAETGADSRHLGWVDRRVISERKKSKKIERGEREKEIS
jgi:hypothetical protein